MDPATLITIGTTGAKTAGGLWGGKTVSSETNIQGKIREPVSQSFLTKMTPGSGGSGSPMILPLAIGGLALFFFLRN